MDLHALYPLYFEKLAAYCRRMAGASAEDLAQEAFLRALSDAQFAGLRVEQQRAWLNRTARNLAADQARRRAREPAPEIPACEEVDLTAAEVGQALDILEPEERRLVSLRYFAGWNSTQIGKAYGIPAATVRTRLRAAARKLKAFYYS